MELAKEGNLEDVEPEMQIKYYSTLKKIAMDNMTVPSAVDSHDPIGEWHYGPTFTGKTTSQRLKYPNAYLKAANTKWWDGYRDQEVCIDASNY